METSKIPFLKNRSYRRFDQSATIPLEHLESMVEAARLSPSSRNVQPIKFYLSNDSLLNREIFPALAWAGYLKEWEGPAEGERPSAYIILLHDKDIAAGYSCDHGIFAQSILLRAVELGWGGCMIASIKKSELQGVLELPVGLDPILVVALGKPTDTVVVDDAVNGEIKYWREPDGTHHVPKRPMDELIYRNNR